MTQFTVVVDDCATPPAPGIRHVRLDDTQYGNQSFRLRIDDLCRGLPDRVTAVQLDWIRIFAAMFAADLAGERGEGDLDWYRGIDLHVPVAEPDRWSPMGETFEELFELLTYDSLRLHFHPLVDSPDPPRQGKDPFPECDAVALVSGGMDSFVGLVELLDEGRQPLVVSHRANPATLAAQAQVRSVVDSMHDGTTWLRFTAERANRTTFPWFEPSQRSRTLLYLAASTLVAASLPVADVYLNENGVMAVHVPMTAARVGSLSTRSAAPRMLQKFSDLASSALEVSITIRNALVGSTKPEVAELGDRLGLHDHMDKTVSCWKIARNPRHCGSCEPCLVRRISSDLHNIPDVEYTADVLNDPAAIDDPGAHDSLFQLSRLAADLEDLADDELELAYAELVFGGEPALSPRETIDMYRRWGEQALTVLRAHDVSSQFV